MKADIFVSITVKNCVQTSVCRMLLAMAGDVEPNPGPRSRRSAGKKFSKGGAQGEHTGGDNIFDQHSGGVAPQQNQRGNEAQNMGSKRNYIRPILRNSSWRTQALSSNTGANQESESSEDDWAYSYHNRNRYGGAAPQQNQRGNEAQNVRSKPDHSFSHSNQNVSDISWWSQNEPSEEGWSYSFQSCAGQFEQEEVITEHQTFEEEQSVESKSIVSVSSSSQVKQLSNLEHLENELKIMKEDLKFYQSNCSFCCNKLETLLEKVNGSKVKEDVLNKILQLMQKRKEFLVSYFDSFRELEKVVKANVSSCDGSRTADSSTQTSTAFEQHGQNEVQNAQQSMHQSQIMEVDLLDVECPVCKHYLYAPIMLCSNGHSICSVCKEKLDSCPICSKNLSEVRNYTLEALLEKLKIPCKYEDSGCTKKIKVADRKSHESVDCDYKPYPCIYCGESFNLLYLEEHFLTCDKGQGFNTVFKPVEPEVRSFTVEGNCKEVVITRMGNLGIFVHRCLKWGNVWYFWVSVAKSVKEAQKYCCEMLTSHTDTVLSYTGPVHSLHIGANDIIAKGYCLTITDAIVKNISEKNGKFPITVSIMLK